MCGVDASEIKRDEFQRERDAKMKDEDEWGSTRFSGFRACLAKKRRERKKISERGD